MLDPFEKCPELKRIKQMLEEIEAGQTGAGYAKIIDKILSQNQTLPGNEQQAEMIKNMLKEKLKNSRTQEFEH